MSRPQKNSRQLQRRRLIATEAARIMNDQGIRDYYHAKTKAARALGIHDLKDLPTNREVQLCAQQHHELFASPTDGNRLTLLRDAACEALSFFRDFHPLAVGAVVSGHVDPHSVVGLHLFAEAVEDVLLYLDQERIPHDQTERVVQFRARPQARYPVLQFMAGEAPIDLTVLPLTTRHQTPIDPVTRQPKERLSLSGLKQLMTTATSDDMNALLASVSSELSG